MSGILLDTSCMVALLCSWHEHHEVTRSYLEKRLARGESMVLAAHGLAETYSVLTRLPFPFRLSENDAMQLLTVNWKKAAIVALTSREYWKVLRKAVSQGVGGGQIYDAIIAACARKAKAGVLVTWNRDHFALFESESLRISMPDSED